VEKDQIHHAVSILLISFIDDITSIDELKCCFK